MFDSKICFELRHFNSLFEIVQNKQVVLVTGYISSMLKQCQNSASPQFPKKLDFFFSLAHANGHNKTQINTSSIVFL